MQAERKTRILIVENESIIARDIKMSLEQLGYDIAGIASDYQAAIEKSHKNEVDLALMDINIDGSKDGIQTARALRMHFNIPVIFLTSLTEFETIQKAKTSEPFGYLVKPFRKDELQSSIEIALFNHAKTKHLQEDIQKFSSAMRVLETAIIILDPEGIIDYYNSRVEELTGWSKEDKSGFSINQVLEVEGKPAWLYLESFSEKERLQNSFDFENDSCLIRKDGERLNMEGNISSFHTPEGTIAGYIVVLMPHNDKSAHIQHEAKDEVSGQIINNFFFLKDKSSLYRIHVDEITHVEALGNYVKVHTPKKVYTALIPLKDIEHMLPEDKFFRVHRSFIVALDQITAIHNVELQVQNNTIPIGKTFKEDLLKRIQII